MGGGGRGEGKGDDLGRCPRPLARPKTAKVLSGAQKFESPLYLVKPRAGFVISCDTPRMTISRSPPGRLSPVACEPKSTVRDCGQRRVAIVETAVRELLIAIDSL